MPRIIPFLVAAALWPCGLGAAPIALTNHNFELPATGKILGWDSAGSDIPGWKSLVTATNSGVESDWMGHTDGVWTAFVGHGDVSALNLSSHTIAANEEFTFTLDARDNWTDSTGASLRIGLYFDAAGQMVPVASTDVHPLTNWQSYSVTFPAHSVPAAIGKRIGVWFQNIYYPGLSWIGADNARLDVATSPFYLWQVAYFGGGNTNAAPDADPDGDGLCNPSEFLAGTNPTNAASNLKLTSAAMETNGLRLAWKTAGTRTNVVQVSADLLDTSFVDASGPIVLPGTGDTATNFLDPAARTNAGSRFYRVRQEPLPPGSLTERVARWHNWRFGMFIHWGPVSIAGTEVSWSRNGPRGTDGCSPITGGLPTATYDSLYHQFNPTNFNADQWVKIARETGMKYVVLTAKHHDGFCLWPTKVHDYHIGNSPFQRDVCGELASAIHRAGLGLGWYYSAPDWKDADCRTTNNAAYVTRMQGHLRELLTNYGKVDVLWIDADGCSAPWDRATTYPLIKSLQPAMLINNRLDMGNMDDVHAQRIVPPAHFYTPEQKVGNYDDQRPWESCITIGTQWAWKPNDTLKPVKEIVQTVANCAGVPDDRQGCHRLKLLSERRGLRSGQGCGWQFPNPLGDGCRNRFGLAGGGLGRDEDLRPRRPHGGLPRPRTQLSTAMAQRRELADLRHRHNNWRSLVAHLHPGYGSPSAVKHYRRHRGAIYPGVSIVLTQGRREALARAFCREKHRRGSRVPNGLFLGEGGALAASLRGGLGRIWHHKNDKADSHSRLRAIEWVHHAI